MKENQSYLITGCEIGMSRMTCSRKWGLYLSLTRVRNKFKIYESLEVLRNTVWQCLAIGNVSRKTMRANKTECLQTFGPFLLKLFHLHMIWSPNNMQDDELKV